MGESTLAPVAIVGMGCVFPGAANVDELWRNVCAGVDAIGEVPAWRWDPVFYEPGGAAADRFYCRRGGFVDDVVDGDPVAADVTPADVDGAEPDQLLALAQATAALEDSGRAHERVAADRVGVVVGRGAYRTPGIARLDQRVHVAQQLVEGVRALLPGLDPRRVEQVRDEFVRQLGRDAPEAAIGLVPNLAASRIAHRFDLQGPAYTVDAACASSLLAVDHALRDLTNRRCDLVIAGGSHHCHDVTLWSLLTRLGALSRRQQIRPFSQAADGLLIGEGTGFVVLKRLADADRDGDRVYAVLRGSGVASDGRARSLLNPDVAGQVLAVERAWRSARLDPATVGLVEAHGTATPAGDQAELETLRQAFGKVDGDEPRAGLGSIKSMIGHALPAAGIAGVIKAALAVHHGVLPPTLHADDPHPLVEQTRFRLVGEAEPWPSDGTVLRRAGVSAFGFGGVNAHVVLEQHATPTTRKRPPARRVTPRRARRRSTPVSRHPAVAARTAGGPGGDVAGDPGDRPPVLLLAARDAAELAAGFDRWRAARGWSPDLRRPPSIGEVVGDADGPARLAVVDVTARRLDLARQVLARGTPWRGRDGVWFEPQGLLAGGGRLAFLFPGVEGAPAPGLEDVAQAFDLPPGVVPSSVAPPGVVPAAAGPSSTGPSAGGLETGGPETGGPKPGGPETGEPASLEQRCREVVAAGRLLHRVLGTLGVQPDMVAGHGLGEWCAQAVAGVVGDEHVTELLARLGPGEIELPHLLHLAIRCDGAQAGELIAGLDQVVVSHRNCPHQAVVCGPPDQVAVVAERCRRQRLLARELPFRSGFHSPLLAAHVPVLRRAFGDLAVSVPAVPLWSATTAQPYPSDPEEIRALGVRHLVEPVRFDDLVRALHDAGARLFVQMGVGSLTAFVDDVLAGLDTVAIAASNPQRTGVAQLCHLAAALWVEGCPVDLDGLVRQDLTAAGSDQGQTDREGRSGRGSAARSGRPPLLRLGTTLVRDLTPLDLGRLALPGPAAAAQLNGHRRVVAELTSTLAATAAAAWTVTDAATRLAGHPALPATTGLAGHPALPAVPLPMDAPAADTGEAPAAITIDAPAADAPAGSIAHVPGEGPAAGAADDALAGASPAVPPPEPAADPGIVASVPRDATRDGAAPDGGDAPAAAITTEAPAADAPAGSTDDGEEHPPPRAGERTVVRQRLGLDGEPAWADHAFFRQPEGWPHAEDRFPLVPMTGIVEMLTDVAQRLHPDLVPIAVEDVSTYRWLRVAPPTEVTLRATTRGHDPATGEARVDVVVDGHARGTVVLAAGYPAAPRAPRARLRNERPSPIEAGRFYLDRHTFHGPAYQGVHAVAAVADDGARGVLRSLPAPGALLDNAGQLMACWLSSRTEVDRLVLPTSIGRVERFGPTPPPGALVDCTFTATHVDDRSLRGNLALAVDGRLWCRVTAWEDRRFATDALVYETLQWPERAGMSVDRHGCTLVAERWPDTATRDIVMRRYLGRDERRVYQRHHPRAQRRFLLGRIAAKDAVRRWLWAHGHGPLFPAEVVVVEDAAGRPVVRGPFTEDLRVSVAHVDGMGVARVAEGMDVGVDIEQVRPRRADFEELVLTPGEQQLDPPGDFGRDAWLTCLWTVKVAAARAAGRRDLGGRPRDFEVGERRGTVVRVGDRRVAFVRLPPAAVGPAPSRHDKEHIVAWTLADR